MAETTTQADANQNFVRQGWIGINLDGTLAKFEKWEGIDHIGEPLKPMVETIKKIRANGVEVKIVTERVKPIKKEDGTMDELSGQFDIPVAEGGSGTPTTYTASFFIRRWCEKNLGFVPEITYERDEKTLTIFDNRVVQVFPNDGHTYEEVLMATDNAAKALSAENKMLKTVCNIKNLSAGIFLGALLFFLFRLASVIL